MQRGADALVVEAHLNPVFLGVTRREIRGVRVEGACIGVHQVFEGFVSCYLIDALQNAVVALVENRHRLGPFLAGEQQRQRVVFYALAPQFIHFCYGAEPRRLLAIKFKTLVRRPVGFGIQQFDGIMHPFAIAHLHTGEHRIGRVDIAGADHVVELQPLRLELGNVAGQKVAALTIECIEVAREHLRRKIVVDLGAPIMLSLQLSADAPRNHALSFARRQRTRRQSRCTGGRCARGTAQCEQRYHERQRAQGPGARIKTRELGHQLKSVRVG